MHRFVVAVLGLVAGCHAGTRAIDQSVPVDLAVDLAMPDLLRPPCSASPVGGDEWQRERTTADQPDDTPGAYQVHVLYVEPSDRSASAKLDVDGTLRRSVNAFSAWYRTQMSGAQMRFDTCDGAIDVTYVKLDASFTEAAMAEGTILSPAGPAFVRDRLQAALSATFDAPNKLYLVYYDGLAFARCGGAAYPPQLPGHFTSLYVGGIFNATFTTAAVSAGATAIAVDGSGQTPLPTAPFSATLGNEAVMVSATTASQVTFASALAHDHPAGEVLQADMHPPDCRDNPYSSDGQQLNYWEFSGAHEILHPLGIVGDGALDFAPAPVAPGHLADTNPSGTADLMYQGAAAWGCPTFPPPATAATAACRLDPMHRNYYLLPSTITAVDLARSVFVDPLPTNAMPPVGW